MDHNEIEFKMLVDKETYKKIKNDYYSKNTGDYIQTNYYLFHPLFDEYHYTMRIRYKNDQYELTLKTPAAIGLNEYNINIDEKTKDKIFNHEKVDNKIFDFLEAEDIHYKELECGYYLTTHRIDIPFEYGLLSLDDNTYNGHQDYEIEFEVEDITKGFEEFMILISKYGLTYKKNCLSKTRRMKETLKV